MTIPFIDTHCHLDLFEGIANNPLAEDVSDIKTITVTNAPAYYAPNEQLFSGANHIRVAIGAHPELAPHQESDLEILKKGLTKTKYVGEIGLDGSPQYKNTFDNQLKTFESILKLVAIADNKIITIHSRNAASETVALLEKYLSHTNCKMILHWYTGDLTNLRKALAIGCYFSVNHKMLRSANGKKIVQALPLSNVLTETDAPFTLDGKIKTRLQSLQETTGGLSDIFKISTDAVHNAVYVNFKKLLS